MIIEIIYESKYSLSTVKDGNNVLTGMATITEGLNKTVKAIFNKDNNFLQNIKELNRYYPNYQYADISIDTVMGILCRLTGEVRRLDTLDQKHPILSLKEKVSFKNINTAFQNEVVLLHTPLKEVQNNAGGLIDPAKSDHFLLTKNPLSETLLSIFECDTQQKVMDLLNGMKDNNPGFFYTHYNGNIKADTFVREYSLSDENHKKIIAGLLFTDEINVLKEINGRLFFGKIDDVVSLESYILANINTEGFKPASINEERKKRNVDEVFNIFGFLFTKKILFLINNKLFESQFKTGLNSKSSIKGLAPGSGSITIKDYYDNFVSNKKLSWTMPYSVDVKRDLFKQEDFAEFNSGAKLGITKECGRLIISIDLSSEKEEEFYTRIENAGVATFHLGKKGLAYINSITLGEVL